MTTMSNSTSLVNQVAAAIRSVIGSGPVGLHEPSFEGNEWIYLKECLDSTFVSSVGKFVNQFERDLENYTGAKYAISVVNGTSALQIALKLAGVQSGDEVLVPALTFIATANAATYCNAIPHFVDSEEKTLGIDVQKLRQYLLSNSSQQSGQCINKNTGRRIKALVPMHAFGHPSDIEGLLSLAHDFNIVMVEDAAESLGSFYHGQHTGTFGLLGTLSFNGNKTLTTGGGGAILTNDIALAKHAKHLTTTAKISHAWEFRHDEIGYNFRMPNINAALGCAQLEQIDRKLELKRNLFSAYQKAFSKVEGAVLYNEPPQCVSNYWLQSLILDERFISEKENILKSLNSQGFASRPAWQLLSSLPPYVGSPKMELSTSQKLQDRIINIPSNTEPI